MKLDVIYLIFVGYFIEISDAAGHQGKHVHVKIHVPTIIHKHNHKQTIYKKAHGGGHGDHDKKHIVIHKHEHNHKHKHDHGHKHGHNHKHKHGHKHGHKHDAKHGHKHDHKHGHKHGHKHDHKHKHIYTPKKHHDHGWHHYSSENLQGQNKHDDFSLDPVSFDDDGYKTSQKSVRSEHYEVKKINPHAEFPDDRVVVRGSYKVQETDPHDFTTTSYHSYDSPVSKEIAQALTNFDGRYNQLYPYKKEKESEDYTEAEGEGEGEAAGDHENVEEYDDNEENIQVQNYEDYGDNTETVKEYTAHPDQGQLKLSDHNYNYGSEELEKYILRKVYGTENNERQ